MTWFEKLTGCRESSHEAVRRQLSVEGEFLFSRCNGQSWKCGRLGTPSLEELRRSVNPIASDGSGIKIDEIVANVQHLHEDAGNEHALFQVASQFNLLEMTSPGVTPEDGVGIYEQDYTQGPACAIAAGAGTIYRNYFAVVNSQVGQSRHGQIDCLADLGKLLGNEQESLWRMVNGYALPTLEELNRINYRLNSMKQVERDELRKALRIGLQWGTQVTLGDCKHTVSQAYCSAMPVSYTTHDADLWEPLARLVLEGAYEATVCAAILNMQQTKNNRVFLTLLGGGVFGNRMPWIIDAARRALSLYSSHSLNVSFVSYGGSNAALRNLIDEF